MDIVGDEYQFHHGDANHRVSVHSSNRKPHDGVSSPFIWHWLMWVIDFLTSPSFGVVMALAVIGIIHYKAVIFNFISNIVENGIRETLLDCLLNLCDLTRAYYQIVCEVIRNFFSASGYSGATSSAGYLQTGTTDNRSSSMTMSKPPPLAIIPCVGSSVERKHAVGPAVETNGNGNSTSMMKRQPLSGELRQSAGHNDFSLLEPAFLDERDYPKGWLVYHPTLGVISKEEADKHDRKASSILS